MVHRHIAQSREDNSSLVLVENIIKYAGLVDANALCFVWPVELQSTRVCVVSGPISRPTFSCFVLPHCTSPESLTDIILRCVGSHFTILRPTAEAPGTMKVLSLLLQDAKSSGLTVDDIINQAVEYHSMPLSIRTTVDDILAHHAQI